MEHCIEGIRARKPLLLLNRDEIAEDRVTIQSIEKLRIGISCKYNENFNNMDPYY